MAYLDLPNPSRLDYSAHAIDISSRRTIDPVRRSENMRRIRSTYTKSELRLRKLVYSLGVRYRLHRKDLPGNPDLVFASRRKVILSTAVSGTSMRSASMAESHVPRLNIGFPNSTEM
jgi:DNA mismatch endonuclease (patch repair protein)